MACVVGDGEAETGSLATSWHSTGTEKGAFAPLAELDSATLGRRHRLRIYLPAGYAENTLRRYPVFYMQDGRNLFFPEEAFRGRDRQVGESLGLLDAMSAVDRAIVVGIDCGDRMAEYTQPGYLAYARFVVEEIRPELLRRFPFLDSPSETGVIGSSLGGVVSFYMAYQHPQVFGYAACMSSAFTHRDDLIERVLAKPKRHAKFYLDSSSPSASPAWPAAAASCSTGHAPRTTDRPPRFRFRSAVPG